MISGEIQKKRVILVDDEPAAINNMRAVIQAFDELEIVAEFNDGKTAIESINRLRPDIVFLDIEMPEVNGFDVARATSDVNYQLVFATAYDRYALEAFDTNAIDYLLKPIRPALLEKCIKKILHLEDIAYEALEKQKTASDSLVLSDGNSLRVLNQQHVKYIEGIGRYRRIHLTEAGAQLHHMDTIVSDTTLDDFAAQLPGQGFMRLHRSYIVNLSVIMALRTESRRQYVTLMGSDIHIPVSRKRLTELKQLL